MSTDPSGKRSHPRILRHQLCGIGDEAASSLDCQISIHQSLRWSQLELRSIDGVRIGQLTEDAAKQVAEQLHTAGIRVPVVASTIGDWSGTIERDFREDVEELRKLLAFAERLDAPYIRIMSYPAGGVEERSWKKEVFRRILELCKRADDRGKKLLHENCHGWAAANPERALDLVEATKGVGFALLFDIGNPVAHGYDGHAYLTCVLPWVAHLHVKDVIAPRGAEKVRFTFPGEGDARVLDCIDLAVSNGFSGAVSIEPHIAFMPHDGKRASEQELGLKYQDYASSFMHLLGERLAAEAIA